jgi:hypothetical protein
LIHEKEKGSSMRFLYNRLNSLLSGSYAPVITIGIIAVLLFITILNFYYRPKEYTAKLIVKDLAVLQAIFKKIDDRCKILGFDYQKNPINFLNIQTFKGSEVGSMNLTYPAQWQGPYVPENLRMQGKEYQVVKTKAGLFIVPGDGVQLPNGLIVGKDIILNEKTDMSELIKSEKGFIYKGHVLAVPLAVGYSEFKKALLEGAADIGPSMLGAMQDVPVRDESLVA